jgi:hypothetical protein
MPGFSTKRRRFYARPDRARQVAAAQALQLGDGHARHLQVDVDAVHEGPLMRFWYLLTIDALHVHCFSESP